MNAVLTTPQWLQTAYSKSDVDVPAWFAAMQEKQWQAFCQQGIPTRKNERWKYTDLSFLTNKHFAPAKRPLADDLQDCIQQHRLQQGASILLVFVNGYFMSSLSDMPKLPQQVVACNISEALQTQAQWIEPYWSQMIDAERYPFASLNAAVSTDGLFFYLPAHCELESPIHLLSIVTDESDFIAHPRHLFILGEQSKLLLVEEQWSLTENMYMMNHVSTLVLEKGAQLEQVKIQNEGRKAIHMAHYFVWQKQDSSSVFTNFSLGAAFARDELIVQLEGKGADCRTSGFYHLRDHNQYVDHHIDINHRAPHSKSEMLYKGILENKSRAVFNGRLYVEKDAQKILAYQANHNMLLAKEAEVYSKPELEIYADDVKCKHGASIGQLDQDALFYLRSRGVEKEEAIAMLLQGFADEILQRVQHAGIKMRVQEAM